jgi:hypothetical protein
MKKTRHNEAVLYARRWFRGLFETHPDEKEVDNPIATFDAAGLTDFLQIRDAVLAIEPFFFLDKDIEDDN